MPDFDDLRAELAQHRRQSRAQRQAALLSYESARQADRALARASGAADDEHGPLAQAAREARARAVQAAEQLATLTRAGDQLRARFETYSDPRETIDQWPDSNPILLLPLRLETRFRPQESGGPQLWVRIYPDTCLVDSFEDSLTEAEVQHGRDFWAGIWLAVGDEARERAAWRDLVAAHGSGRSGWLVRQYQPLNPLDKPEAGGPGDVLLVIVAAQARPAAATEYWEAVWRADGDATAEAVAYATLVGLVGPDQAGQIAADDRPVNISDGPTPPTTRATATVRVAVLQLTSPADLATRRTSWSSPPRVDLLPERFVVVGYRDGADPVVGIGSLVTTPLVAGPDPNAAPAQQLKPVGDDLQIPANLKWMFDFDAAVDAGMAMRVTLDAAAARDGFTRLIVLGVRLADSAAEGREHLQTLLEHHLYSRPGLEILPQGVPTNNTEKSGSGYSTRDDPEASFDVLFRRTPQYTRQDDEMLRRDGQWLADVLGLDDEVVQRFPHAGGTDQLEARAMQIALWPGTMGYQLRTLLSPVLDDEQVTQTRAFFTRHVSGRGPVPAIRIGRQPYGIVPTTAFDRFTGGGRLTTVLNRIDADWAPLVNQVSFIGKRTGGDPHQILLDVLGLHPGSVEYYPLPADSVDHKFFELALLNYSVPLELIGLFPAVVPVALLRSFGYTGEQIPGLLTQIYRARQTPLTGPLIDDRPLSESAPVRAYAAGRNYLEWLVDAAGTGIEQVQQEKGFDRDTRPSALLYLLLRHALEQSLYAVGERLRLARPQARLAAQSGARWAEPTFVHVQDAEGSESRYAPLFSAAPEVTGSESVLLGDYIAENLREVDAELREQIEALERLAQVPTARLERVFAEHVDTVGYRLDAWKTGLLTRRLAGRSREDDGDGEIGLVAGEGDGEGGEGGGLFLGAFGWLEAVRPGSAVLTAVDLPPDVAAAVNRADDPPLMRDSANEGLIHAPSLGHATTAAVLRNGYLANDGRLAVDLASRRVRLALGIQEGMRAGQSLGALLGYRFERFVQDNGPLQVRDLIYPLRRAFPLAADQIAATATTDGEAQESVAAVNVVDGRKLVEFVEANRQFTYPFGVSTLPRRDAAQEAALTDALRDLRDANDALADLVLAEGVHQAVLGNYERSAGTLDAFAKGGYPPEPEVVRTPRSGVGLTLRTAIHLSPHAPANPIPALPLTPLAAAEPALNGWLSGRLPAPGDVGCDVRFTDRVTGLETTEFVSQTQLGLHPIDLVYRLESAAEQALTDLEDRILQYTFAHFTPRHDREVRIRQTEPVPGKITWFELQPLVRSLRQLTVATRPLRPGDLSRPNDAVSADQATAVVPRSRIQVARDDLHDNRLPDLDALAAALTTETIDDAVSRFSATIGGLAAYRLPQTGTGFAAEWRAATYSALVARIAERVQTWDARLAGFDDRLQTYDAGLPAVTTEAQRITFLQAAELMISTRLTAPAPTDSTAYRVALTGRRAAFVTVRNAWRDLVEQARPTLTELLSDVTAQLPIADYDPDPFDVAEAGDEIARFRQELLQTVARLRADVVTRLAGVDGLLAQHDAAAAGARAALLQKAAQLIFGEDFQLIPAITLPAPAVAELDQAWQWSTTGDLTTYLTDANGGARDFPVEDWLHGVARVRETMHHWENVVLLGEAFGLTGSSDLTPLQLPFASGEPWLALEFPPDHVIAGDRLLYAAHFADPFDPADPVVGLLIDEWTEVIPGATETTGISFHLNRPNAEPPQAWLLAVSPSQGKTWTWDDLLAVVNHTLDSAKRRAIEPVHIDSTAYSSFLPATTSPYTFPEISISNNLLRNLEIFSRLPKGPA